MPDLVAELVAEDVAVVDVLCGAVACVTLAVISGGWLRVNGCVESMYRPFHWIMMLSGVKKKIPWPFVP